MSTQPRQAVLDTSVLINPERVTEHADELAVSVLTIAELQYGITADNDLMEQQRRRSRVQDALNRFEVLPFDLAATEFYGTLCTLVRRQGRSPRGRRMDLMIAATAGDHGHAGVTAPLRAGCSSRRPSVAGRSRLPGGAGGQRPRSIASVPVPTGRPWWS